MSDSDASRRSDAISRARAAYENFKPYDQSWIDGLHSDVVMEFPVGPTVGLPASVAGKDHCVGLFQQVSTMLGLTFSDIHILGMADPDAVLVQCKGAGAMNGKPYNQQYMTLLEFKDGKMKLYREYFDTKVVADVMGDLSSL